MGLGFPSGPIKEAYIKLKQEREAMQNALTYINAVGSLLAAAEQLTPVIEKLVADAKVVLETGSPTDEQWASLNALLDANTAALNAPMQGE